MANGNETKHRRGIPPGDRREAPLPRRLCRPISPPGAAARATRAARSRARRATRTSTQVALEIALAAGAAHDARQVLGVAVRDLRQHICVAPAGGTPAGKPLASEAPADICDTPRVSEEGKPEGLYDARALLIGLPLHHELAPPPATRPPLRRRLRTHRGVARGAPHIHIVIALGHRCDEAARVEGGRRLRARGSAQLEPPAPGRVEGRRRRPTGTP